MASLMETLAPQLSGGALRQISSQLGTDEDATGDAIAAALPTLLGALGRNAASPEGASALAGALDRDHDGGVLDDLAGFLGGASSGPGDGILRHALGKAKRQGGLDAGALAGMLGREQEAVSRQAPQAMGFVGQLLDTDGDGDVDAGDLAKHDMGLFGKMFGGR